MTTTITKIPRKRAMAIAIAKDVLKRLKLEKLRVSSGSYLLVTNSSKFPKTGSLQEKIDKAEANCEVCALGGMFLSHVRRHNEVQCEKEFHIIPELKKVFSPKEIALIEGVFEGIIFNPHLISSSSPSTYFLESACNNYARMILKKDKSRRYDRLLSAICRNIIRNKGKFIIPKICFKGKTPNEKTTSNSHR